MGEFGLAVGVDGAAGVLVGVDQRRESEGGLEAFVEAEAEFVQEGQVGAEAGQHDHLVHRIQAAAVLADQDQAAVVVPLEGVGAEAGDGVRVAAVHRGLRGQAEGAARGQLVGLTAAEGGAGDPAAQDPRGVRACSVAGLGEVGEVGESGEGGGAGADDGGTPAHVPGPDGGVGQVGDAVGDPVGGRLLAEGGEAAGAGGAGGGPGAGGVDDCAGEEPLLAAVACFGVDHERLGVAVGVDDPVPARPGDAGDAGAVVDSVAEGVGEGLEVEGGPVAAGGVGGRVGRHPAGRCEELLGGRVDDFTPGGEQAHVRPLAGRGPGVGAGFEDEEVQAALAEVGGGGQAGGAGPDHDDGQFGGGLAHDVSPVFSGSGVDVGGGQQQRAPVATASRLACGPQQVPASSASLRVPQHGEDCAGAASASGWTEAGPQQEAAGSVRSGVVGVICSFMTTPGVSMFVYGLRDQHGTCIDRRQHRRLSNPWGL